MKPSLCILPHEGGLVCETFQESDQEVSKYSEKQECQGRTHRLKDGLMDRQYENSIHHLKQSLWGYNELALMIIQNIGLY